MDGREAMVVAGGSAPYYIQHRGVASSAQSAAQTVILQTPQGFRPSSSHNISAPSTMGSTFSVDPKPASFVHNMGVPSGVSLSEPVKKKRGRPRKYAPYGQVSLELSPLPPKLTSFPASDSQAFKRGRGRPPGTGRKQQLATLGEWMNSSAGLAFAPHVISVGAGEGHFEILCLSGSYLIAEDGGPRNRTGGVSASLSSQDGHVFGGGVAVLIAASIVQVVVCSFVYGGSKTKSKPVTMPESDMNSAPQPNNKLSTPIREPVSQNFSSTPINAWTDSRLVDLRNPHTDIDLTR
ncbi:AT-hook motif nuclear-localized protein 5-like isoform X2 [Mangifera indica]|uniref:AT-hook motif nuclear-localized protein 5-like isoform X2 n=1 Tax=Mangifera indica TaxID=29780 RepID=UPI001CFA6442|nr:AT-hook motif nuclear-localized protein 5-like isoform X2 [Mangifera indica]